MHVCDVGSVTKQVTAPSINGPVDEPVDEPAAGLGRRHERPAMASSVTTEIVKMSQSVFEAVTVELRSGRGLKEAQSQPPKGARTTDESPTASTL